MITRSTSGVLKKTLEVAPVSIGNRRLPRCYSSHPLQRRQDLSPPDRSSRPSGGPGNAAKTKYTSVAEAQRQKRNKDREFFISVLESSATKRDAKTYLQTFGSPAKAASSPPQHIARDSIVAVRDAPRFVQGKPEQAVLASDVPHVAVVKFKNPHLWPDEVLGGVAHTLSQLRTLGLLGLIVVDCDFDPKAGPQWRTTLAQEADRIASAIGQHGMPGARVVDSSLSASLNPPSRRRLTPATSVSVEFGQALSMSLQSGYIPVVPPYALVEQKSERVLADANEVVLSLAQFLSGLQIPIASTIETTHMEHDIQISRKAMVDRVIIVDAVGGIPTKFRPGGAHVFINMEDEYDAARTELDGTALLAQGDPLKDANKHSHLKNLQLARDCLAILPSTSSAIITSPAEAANLIAPTSEDGRDGLAGSVGSVGTRRRQNPLIHNLLTDRPVHSPSLPPGRVKPTSPSSGADRSPRLSTTTLAKKGLPVTIFPSIRQHRWRPPEPGGPRLRLTDNCVDLSRLVHLINDSFGRKLDTQHYLERVTDRLAGIIIAGEYEGGAILTWERPFGMDEETAHRTGRLVPYLDKFAVLKRSQGAGGVADILFNAMIWDCFPDGVCWRSRMNNPVNKWYFERSKGTWKLDDSNWTMFWTTPGAALDEQKIRDYEDVCRSVVPSWADMKQLAD